MFKKEDILKVLIKYFEQIQCEGSIGVVVSDYGFVEFNRANVMFSEN